MANAKLHIICGNCGCNDDFKFAIDSEGIDMGDYFIPEVYIKCDNCSTSHSLSDNAEQQLNEKGDD
jgi:hypothetical protein